MNGIESELFDLEECLMRNDGMADGSTYSTIVGIANKVSELESENAKLIVKLNAEHIVRQNVEIEYAKLREDFEFANNEWEKESLEYLNLQAENATLRELVKYAYECAIHSDHATCDDCERINGCCILVGRMRELGVETENE